MTIIMVLSHRSRPLLSAVAIGAVALASCATCANAFLSPPPSSAVTTPRSKVTLRVSSGAQPDAPKTIEEDAALQWGLFTRHHALGGEWWGTWSTYNYMGDLEDSTIAG